VDAHPLEPTDVQVYLPRPDVAAAGHRDTRTTEPPEQRAEHHDGRAHPTHELVGRLERADVGRVDVQRVALPVYPGAEVAVNFDILDQIKGPGPYCINGGSYMLVELPALDIPCYADEFFFTLQARGITPILSHPERHPLIADDPAIVLEWVRRGLLVQINAPSLAGKMGERALKTAEVLVKSRLVHFLGTDAHGLHARPPCLTAGAEKLTSLVGRDAARQILVANPGRVIQNLPVEAPEVEKIAEPDRPGMLRQWISKFCAR